MVNFKKVTISVGKPVEVSDAKALSKSILNGEGIAFINQEGNPLLLPDLQPSLKDFIDLMIETQEKCAEVLDLLAGFSSLPVVEGSPVNLEPSYIIDISTKKTEILTLKTELETLKGNLE